MKSKDFWMPIIVALVVVVIVIISTSSKPTLEVLGSPRAFDENPHYIKLPFAIPKWLDIIIAGVITWSSVFLLRKKCRQEIRHAGVLIGLVFVSLLFGVTLSLLGGVLFSIISAALCFLVGLFCAFLVMFSTIYTRDDEWTNEEWKVVLLIISFVFVLTFTSSSITIGILTLITFILSSLIGFWVGLCIIKVVGFIWNFIVR